MSASDSSYPHADLLIRAKTVHTLVDNLPSQRAIAIRDGRIVAISTEPNGLDQFVASNTKILEFPTGTVLPAFTDTHTHLTLAGEGVFDVPVRDVHSLPELLDRIRQRAAMTPIGEFVITSSDWQEVNLEEKRLPTLAELDSVSTDHPIVVRRGGHNIVVNSVVLERAGVTSSVVAPSGGVIGRDANGELNGLFQDAAMKLLNDVMPHADLKQQVDGLEAASQVFASTGTGCVRDCHVALGDLRALETARNEGKLHTRVRVLVASFGCTSAADLEQRVLEPLEAYRHLQFDPFLSVVGIKFLVDGGFEGAATIESYASDPNSRGLLLWEPKPLADAYCAVLRRGWRVGTHAFGDRAIQVVLDAYAEVHRRLQHVPRGALVLEHAGLATASERRQAKELGVSVTVQQPLQHDGAVLIDAVWGPERAERLFPIREWIDEGVDIGAGSDFPVGSLAAMRSVWGMVTRETVVGVRGAASAISVEEAISLHTTRAAELLREEDTRGRLLPGMFADLTVWDVDPFKRGAQDPELLRDLMPTCTIVDGKVVVGDDDE